MTKANKQLRNTFGIQLSEPKWRTRLRGARGAIGEAAISKVERKVDPAVLKRVAKAEERAQAALQRKQEREAEQKAAAAARTAAAQARQAQQKRCTCKRPRVDRKGLCTRCKAVPINKPRR